MKATLYEFKLCRESCTTLRKTSALNCIRKSFKIFYIFYVMLTSLIPAVRIKRPGSYRMRSIYSATPTVTNPLLQVSRTETGCKV